MHSFHGKIHFSPLSDMLVWRLGRGAAAVARMASSSSSLSSLPRLFIPPHRAHHEAAMATSAGASQALRDGGGMQMQVSCSMFEASSLKFFNLLFLGSNSDLFCCSCLWFARDEGFCDAEVGRDGVVLRRGLGLRAAAVEQGGAAQVAQHRRGVRGLRLQRRRARHLGGRDRPRRLVNSSLPYFRPSVSWAECSEFLNRSGCSSSLLFGAKSGRIWFGSLRGRRWAVDGYAEQTTQCAMKVLSCTLLFGLWWLLFLNFFTTGLEKCHLE